MPSGPVSMDKAWIEMIYRYFAMAIGVLIITQALIAWVARAAPTAVGVAVVAHRPAAGRLAAGGTDRAGRGWVSTNYAVLACTDFPTCNGQWVPPMDFAHGFHLCGMRSAYRQTAR